MKNGFPVTAGADSELLALDLLGDKFPELIFQNKYGGIQIINYKGDIIEHIASNSQLMGIGVYNGKNAMIINNKLILFNSYKVYRKTGDLIHLSSILFVLTFFIPLLPTGGFFSTFNGTIFWINFSFVHAFLSKPKE